jgi:hypothetical protein
MPHPFGCHAAGNRCRGSSLDRAACRRRRLPRPLVGLDFGRGQKEGDIAVLGRKLASVTATAIGLALLAGTAVAQDPEANVSVTERARPELDPLGIRAGGFMMYPRLRLSTAYDSNIFATRTNREDDIIILVEPQVTFNSDFPRHAMNFGAGGQVAFFLDESDENYQDLFAFLSGRLDVVRDAAIDGQLRVDRLHETRDSPEDPGARKPQRYVRGLAALGYRQSFNRLSFRVGGQFQTFDYSSVFGLPDDRDRDRYEANARVGFQVAPRINLFTEGAYNWVRYDEDVDRNGFERDSDGFAIRAGVGIEITAVLFGEVFGGYRKQRYDEATFDDVDGFNFGGRLTWNPTGLTSLTFTGSRDIEATTQSGAAGNFQTDLGLRVDHELMRSVLVNARVGWRRDDFQGTNREDDTLRAGAGITYQLNRNIGVDLDYGFTDRDSSINALDYSRHVVRLGVTGRL